MRKSLLIIASLLCFAVGEAFAQTDVTSTYLPENITFDNSADWQTSNVAASGTANSVAVTGFTATGANWCSSATFGYGSEGQLNGVAVPSQGPDGETDGGCLGISVGWSSKVTYVQETAVTLPAGSYTLKYSGYNNLDGVTQFKSLVGFVATDGTSYLSSKTSFAYGEWVEDEVSFSLDEDTEGNFQIAGQAVSGSSGNNAKVFFDGVALYYSSALDAAQQAYIAALDSANAVANSTNYDYSNVFGSEMVALKTAIASYSNNGEANTYSTAEEYNAAAEALLAATTTVVEAEPVYSKLYVEVPKSIALGVEYKRNAKEYGYDQDLTLEQFYTIMTSNMKSALTSATAEIVQRAIDSLYCRNYNVIRRNYTVDLTPTEMSSTNNLGTNKGQHWDGTTSSTYYEQSEGWSKSSWSMSFAYNPSLPAGDYVIMVATRANANTATMSVDGTVVENLANKGGTGYGIDVYGYAALMDDSLYANSDAGYGWEYRYYQFTLDDTKDVTIEFAASAIQTQNWVSIANFQLLCRPSTTTAKEELANDITDGKTITDNTANVGDDAFEIPADIVEALSDAIDAAQTVYDNEDATLEEIQEAIDKLNDAIDAYNNAEINDPGTDDTYKIVLIYDGWKYDGCAATYVPNGRSNQGLYNITYLREPDVNYGQQFIFTKVSGNNYTISQIDADNVQRYICLGTAYSGNTSQIRTTENADDAALFTIIPTTTDSIFNIYNVAASNYVGSQDEGVYTVNSHINFKLIKDNNKAQVPVTVAAGKYGTRIFPFIPQLTDVTFYSCESVSGNQLVLTEVESPVANVPYILYNAGTENVNTTLEDRGHAGAATYTNGLLTGVFEGTTGLTGNYVLQTQDAGQKFYLISDDTFEVPAYRIYLTVPAESSVNAFSLPDINTTGIEAVADMLNGDGVEEIYNAAGMKVNVPQKGVNIFKMNNGKTVKVIIK